MKENINLSSKNNLLEITKTAEAFGEMLRIRSISMSKEIRKKALNAFGQSNMYDWGAKVRFPEKNKLSTIAKIYGFNLKDLTNQWNLSKEAREQIKILTKTKKEISDFTPSSHTKSTMGKFSGTVDMHRNAIGNRKRESL